MGAQQSRNAAAATRERRLVALEGRVKAAEGHASTSMRGKVAAKAQVAEGDISRKGPLVSASAGDLHREFLLPLFFCDVCDIPGITVDIGMRAFKACLDAGEMGILRGVFDWAESAGVPSDGADFTHAESLDSAMNGAYEANHEYRVSTPAIVDVGYIDNASKNAHAVQLLVHVSNGRAIVGIANTGDGALAPSEGKATVVALGSTTEREARALLAMAVRVRGRGLMHDARHLAQFRTFVLGKLHCVVASREPSALSAHTSDRHKIVRSLSVVKQGIRAQTQLSGSCVFLSTLWALGILEGIRVGCVASPAGGDIEVDASRLLATIGNIDRTLKGTAMAALSKEKQLARLAALRYGHETTATGPATTRDVRVTTYRRLEMFAPTGKAQTLIASPDFGTWREAAVWVVDAHQMLPSHASFPETVLSFELFWCKSRSLLRDASEVGAVDALRVATFCAEFRDDARLSGSRYYRDVASGILLVLATRLVEASIGIPEAALVERYHISELAILTTFSTSLPWAAAAMERLLKAIDGKRHLIFSNLPDHVQYLASMRTKSVAATLLGAAAGTICVGEITGREKLAPLQRAALEFLCERPEVAALNIVMSWLVADLYGVAGARGVDPLFVFGATSNGITFNVAKRGTAPDTGSPVLVMGARMSAPVCTASSNIEYLYAATRDVVGSGREGESGPEDLCLRAPHEHDSAALEEWFDTAHAGASYEGRSFAYAMRRLMLPLSSRGVTDARIATLRAHADRTGQGEGESAEAQFVRKLLRESPGASRFDAGEIFEIWHQRADIVGAQCAIALAVAMGRSMQLLARLSYHRGVARTYPDSTWALTEVAAPNADGRFVVDARSFVFDATAGVACAVHGRLVRAGCAFDHWETTGGSYIALADRTRIELPSGKITRDGKSGVEEYTLDVRASDWWDETNGAGVLPVVDARGDRHLLVVPASMGSIATLHLSAASASAKRDRGDSGSADSATYLLNRAPFVVAFDRAGVMPEAETPELACVFVAYAYAGSVCGTRLMPLIAAHAFADDRVLRVLLEAAPCPMGHYTACALVYPLALRPELRKHLRCALREEGAEFGELRDTLAGFRARYGADEWRTAHGPGKPPADSWELALEARTGKRIRDDQREKIDAISRATLAGGCVAQIHMGFGKSSVVVPMLVGVFLRRAEIRLVVVTQPARLVAAAAAVIGTLVATHPTVDEGRKQLKQLIYVLGERDFRAAHEEIGRMLRGWCTHKLVAVMSTADMQALVRDFPLLFYGNAGAIAHIADEVDGESDPLTCEVAIQGRETTAHPDPGIARSMGEYYEAAFLLVHCERARLFQERLEKEWRETSPGEEYPGLHEMRAELKRKRAELDAKLEALDKRSESGVKVGERLRAVHASLAGVSGPKHRVQFGMPDDERRLLAVPYRHAGVASTSEYVDPEVKVLLTLLSTMRKSDFELVRRDVTAKFGSAALKRLKEQKSSDTLPKQLEAEYWATQLAMPQMRVSTTETVVAFADLLGAARTFVGFSGTMGIAIDVPKYEATDARAGLTLAFIPDADRETGLKIVGAKCHEVRASPFGPHRARAVLDVIRGKIAELRKARAAAFVCVVDASGELGVFEDDVAQVEKQLFETVGYFDDSGALQNKDARTRYYRHRDARGVDSDMPDGTVGLAIVNMQMRRSAVEQAIYRLRGLDAGVHTLRFVVALDESMAVTGAGLATRFAENEAAYIDAAGALKARQQARALSAKESAASFEHKLAYAEFGGGLQTHTAEQQAEQQAVAQHIVNTQVLGRCYERPPVRRAAGFSFAGGKSSIGDTLQALGIEISQILETPALRKDHRTATLRRAFGVGPAGPAGPAGSAGSKPRLVVMTIVEAWSRAYTGLALYTHDGALLRIDRRRANGAEQGPVLLGRYLCDDRLSLDEEVTLVAYAQSVYGQSDTTSAALQALATCLLESEFLTKRTLLLEKLRTTPIQKIHRDVSADVAMAIEAAVGPSLRLRGALCPAGARVPARSGFGKGRYSSRKRGASFV